MRKKQVMLLALFTAMMMLCTACGNEGDQRKATGASQTAGESAEESTAPEETEPEETEPEKTSNSLMVSNFDGDKDTSYLNKYGLTAYKTPLANIDAVNNIRYVDIGDGAEIYKGGAFCGWFAAWDFSDVSDLSEETVIGGENIDDYIRRIFGTAHSLSCERTGEQELSDGITRYDYLVQVVAQVEDDWMISSGIYSSEDELDERRSYTLSISAYCAEDSNYGFILCLEKDELSDRLLGKVQEAISFKKNSFTGERKTLEAGHPVQEMYTAVENKYTFTKDYEQMSRWFENYSGEKLQRIAGTADDNYSPAVCPDIIFYRADEGESMETVVEAMFRAIMEPLTVKTDARPFTVTGYFLDEQQILVYESEANMWLLPALNGYYAYEGTDSVTMETALNGNQAKDGMVPFFRQGSSEMFQYILIREGDVYRLQRAVDMGLEVKNQEK